MGEQRRFDRVPNRQETIHFAHYTHTGPEGHSLRCPRSLTHPNTIITCTLVYYGEGSKREQSNCKCKAYTGGDFKQGAHSYPLISPTFAYFRCKTKVKTFAQQKRIKYRQWPWELCMRASRVQVDRLNSKPGFLLGRFHAEVEPVNIAKLRK